MKPTKFSNKVTKLFATILLIIGIMIIFLPQIISTTEAVWIGILLIIASFSLKDDVRLNEFMDEMHKNKDT